MIRTFNPKGITPPASNYSHAASADAGMRWLYISGQVGVDSKGQILEGFSAQLIQCFTNLRGVLEADGMSVKNIVKLVIYVTPNAADVVAEYREIRDQSLGAHAPAATYVGVTSLASKDFLVEVEAVAAASS